MSAELIVDARNAVGECPVWVPQENALYWVDIPNGGLQRWNAATGHIAAWKAPQMLACIARTTAGNWLAGMESGFFPTHPAQRWQPRHHAAGECRAPALGHAPQRWPL